MEDNPLDLEAHELDTTWEVWKRRILFLMLIVLCVTFAAPSFSSCSGVFESRGELAAEFNVGGRRVTVTDMEFGRIQRGLGGAWVLSGQNRLEDDDVWRYILLDALAREEGIHVPADTLGSILARSFKEVAPDGKLDEALYKELVRTRVQWATHREVTEGFRTLIRVQEYQQRFGGLAALVPTQDAFDAWKKENRKLTVEYVVQPFAPLRDTMPEFTDEELEDWQRKNPDLDGFRYPPRRVIETAVVHVVEVTAEERAAMEAFAVQSGLIPQGSTVTHLAWDQFFRSYNQGRIYTRSAWLALVRPQWEKDLAAHTQKVQEWEDAGKPEGQDPGPAPEDPAQAVWPEQPLEVMKQYWEDFVVKEVLGRAILEHMAGRAEREGRSFADLAAEFAPMGVTVLRNEEPLADGQFAAEYPAGVAEGSDFLQVVRQEFQGPTGDKPFAPVVRTEPLLRRNNLVEIRDRGWMVMRLAGFEPARDKPISEAREEVSVALRQFRSEDQAKKGLEELLAEVEEGTKTFEEAAAARGLEVKRISGFNLRTKKLPPPTDLSTPEAQAQALDIARRNHVQDSWRYLDAVEEGEFWKIGNVGVHTVRATDASFLMRVVKKDYPSRNEFMAKEDTRETAINRLRMSAYQDAIGLLSLESLSKRLGLRRFDRSQDTEAVPSESDSATE